MAVYPRRHSTGDYWPVYPFIIKNSPKDVGYLDVEEKAWLMDNATRSKSGSKVKLSDFMQGIKIKVSVIRHVEFWHGVRDLRFRDVAAFHYHSYLW